MSEDFYVAGRKKLAKRGNLHPVQTGRYILATNEIERLYDTVHRWITNRTPGGIVYGRPRLGKTRAIRFLQYALREDFKDLPIFVIKCNHHKQATERVFFEELLRNVGHGDSESGTLNSKRERLYRFLLESAYKSLEQKIVFIMDEAQELQDNHYQWLKDIYNELDNCEVSLTCILVGQEELLRQRAAFIQVKKQQIVGRFMVHDFKFMGIRTLDDLQTCLRGYDDESEYPLGSDITYTQHFFLEAYEKGFRLYQYAEEMMEAFRREREKANLSATAEIPMQYITSTIEYLLLQYGRYGANVYQISKNMIEEAIWYSGYIEAEVCKKGI
ncbi:ATP-binding protein [Bacillus thuringiensis]|nr:ATP-binding protein [Bacillus thuringiensis]